MQISNELLYETIPEFDFNQTEIEPEKLYEEMIGFMRSKGALGLAANQVGVNVRCFVINADLPLIFFNPKIVHEFGEQIYLDEGCLSFPNMFVKIKRFRNIRVRYRNIFGETVTETFDGMTSRIVQHETDHLNGITFKEHATKYHWDLALNKKKKLDRKQRHARKVL